MKYYCKNCESEFKPGGTGLRLPPVNKPVVHCPFCEKTDVEFGIMPEETKADGSCEKCEVRILHEHAMKEGQ